MSNLQSSQTKNKVENQCDDSPSFLENRKKDHEKEKNQE